MRYQERLANTNGSARQKSAWAATKYRQTDALGAKNVHQVHQIDHFKRRRGRDLQPASRGTRARMSWLSV